jgi:hypothetical protein
MAYTVSQESFGARRVPRQELVVHHVAMERRTTCALRLDLDAIDASLRQVELEWDSIDDELHRLQIGRKDRFSSSLRRNMLAAYAYLDHVLGRDIEPFSDAGIQHMLALNDRVHYGDNQQMMAEFAQAVAANCEKFNANIEPIADWYFEHAARGDHPYKLAAETYVSVVGQPQLFIEGNHRTGSLIASWIDLYAGYPPFVLSVDNALAYFAPSAEIKQFVDRTTWRGRSRLPKYRKAFGTFWKHHVREEYVKRART